MKNNFANSTTPETSLVWKNEKEENRIKKVFDELKKTELYKDFEVIEAPKNGHVVLKIEKIIPANQRGILLLELEKKLKLTVDEGITIWCEPVGDKSKLRSLRGIKFK